LVHGPELKHQSSKEVPTLKEFAKRFLEEHAIANRQKPSGVASKESILRVHLVPALGSKKLDAIRNEDVQRLKSTLRHKATKTVNNVLTVLSVLVRKAVEWEVIDNMPCTIKVLAVTRREASFHDFEGYERLVEAARIKGWRTHLIVLLGGDAGLRVGEMVALHWADVDFSRRRLAIRHSDWRGKLTAPKNGRVRYVPLGATVRRASRVPSLARTSSALQGRWTAAEPAVSMDPCSKSGPRGRRGNWTAHPASHVLLASGNAGRTRQGDSGAGGTPGAVSHAGLHAPESRHARVVDSALGIASEATRAWRHCGDGLRAKRKLNRVK